MNPPIKRYPLLLIALSCITPLACVVAQSPDTPAARLRPIGAPSAVDQYSAPAATLSRFRGTTHRQDPAGQVQPTVLLQQAPGTMQLPDTFTPPPVASPTLPPGLPAAAQPPVAASPAAPRGLPMNPAVNPIAPNPSGSIPSSSDLTPVAPPQLSDGFATIANCNCVTAPSGYTAAMAVPGCATVSYQTPAAVGSETPQAYVAPPAQIAAPAVLPDGALAAPSGGVPKGPLVSFGQQTYPVQVGQGLFGQPKAYVPGQRFRNWIRYLFP